MHFICFVCWLMYTWVEFSETRETIIYITQRLLLHSLHFGYVIPLCVALTLPCLLNCLNWVLLVVCTAFWFQYFVMSYVMDSSKSKSFVFTRLQPMCFQVTPHPLLLFFLSCSNLCPLAEGIRSIGGGKLESLPDHLVMHNSSLSLKCG